MSSFILNIFRWQSFGISTIDEIYVVDMDGILIVIKRKVMDRVGKSAHITGH
jgi:hypothetical protein